jgi:hypothetical protein
MPPVAHATFRRSVSTLLFLLLAVAPILRADDLTGMLQDDPKDLYPASAPAPASQPACVANYNTGFLPMPSWARGVVMPPLPDVLKPMGRKAVLTTPPVPAPQPLAPPKDSAPPTVVVAKPTVVAPTPVPNPALIAVSPFLDWIKANPQAASEQARQQAAAYQVGAEANAAVAPATAPASSTVPPAAPYWMPPLIDAAPFGTGVTGNTTGSSAAIYTTPQR